MSFADVDTIKHIFFLGIARLTSWSWPWHPCKNKVLMKRRRWRTLGSMECYQLQAFQELPRQCKKLFVNTGILATKCKWCWLDFWTINCMSWGCHLSWSDHDLIMGIHFSQNSWVTFVARSFSRFNQGPNKPWVFRAQTWKGKSSFQNLQCGFVVRQEQIRRDEERLEEHRQLILSGCSQLLSNCRVSLFPGHRAHGDCVIVTKTRLYGLLNAEWWCMLNVTTWLKEPISKVHMYLCNYVFIYTHIK